MSPFYAEGDRKFTRKRRLLIRDSGADAVQSAAWSWAVGGFAT
jgi:hypothetical protein